MENYKYKNLEYVITKPDNMDSDKKYPLIIYLHGAGGRGRDINVIKEHSFFNLDEARRDFDFVCAVPQCFADTWFEIFEQLQDFVKMIIELPFIDKDRVYLMGASMGGYTTWQLAMTMNSTFAAIVPICGGGMYWNAGRLKNTPVWAFHGALDDCVLLEESEKMVRKVKDEGGDARLTIYPENGHNAWSDTFRNAEVYKWMLSHTRKDGTTDMSCVGEQFG